MTEREKAMNDTYSEEAVEPQQADEVMEEALQQDAVQEHNEEEIPSREKTMIPLSVAQKLREKKRELELELQWERQERQKMMQVAKPVEEDNSRYESATREDLMNSNAQVQAQAIRAIEEKLWIKQNPDKHERVQEELAIFLKQRPNLARAIDEASNRYEEAYTLMEALTPKQQIQLKKDATPARKQQAPNSPGSIPKAAALNDAIDLMNMSDKEFMDWRKSKQKRR
jgi:hypothetical protein